MSDLMKKYALMSCKQRNFEALAWKTQKDLLVCLVVIHESQICRDSDFFFQIG